MRCFGYAMVLLAATTVAASGRTAHDNWFRYQPHIDRNWKITPDPDDALRVAVERREKSGSQRTYRVMVFYPRPSSAYDVAIVKILEHFEVNHVDADFTVVNFENKDERGRKALRQAEEAKFDLILAMGSESTAWLYEHYRGGAIPVVSVCSKDPVLLGQIADYRSGSKNNFAFTSLNMPIDVQMNYLKELKPELRNITVLVDSKNLSAMQTQAEPLVTYARQRGMQVILGAVQDPSTAREELVNIVQGAVKTIRKSNPALDNSIFWLTGSTSVFREIRTINEHADRVPVISAVPEIVRDGPDTAALAVGISFESNATLAAIYATDILTGRAKAGDMKVGIVAPPDIAVSFLKAREIGLRIPFSFFEAASFVYDYDGHPVRSAYSPAIGR